MRGGRTDVVSRPSSTMQAELKALASRFRDLHAGSTVAVLPNAWDAGSARALERLGFPAVITSSAAIAWSHGYPDGAVIPFEAMLAAVASIARAVRVPVSADLEDGYTADSVDGIERTVEALIDAGAIGLNLEDGALRANGDLVAAEEHAAKIAAARAASDHAGVPIFINARTDVFWRSVGEPDARVDDALERLRLYAEAGADGAFAPGIAEPRDIARLTSELDLPFNVMHMRTTPPLDELERLGVRRLSFGADIYLAALRTVERVGLPLREGDLAPLEGEGVPRADILQAVMSSGGD